MSKLNNITSTIIRKSRILAEFTVVLRKKSALAGLTIIIIIGILGGLADVITEYSYRDYRLADNFAYPVWLAPSDIPRNIEKTFATFQVDKQNIDQNVVIEYISLSNGVTIRIRGVGKAEITLKPKDYIYYPYNPAESLEVKSAILVQNLSNLMPWYNVQIAIENIDLLAKNATYGLKLGKELVKYIPRGIYIPFDLAKERVYQLYEFVNSRIVPQRSISIVLPNPLTNLIQPYVDPTMRGSIEGVNAVKDLILEKDTRIIISLKVVYYCNPEDVLMKCEPGNGIEISLEPVKLRILGKAFGTLGTNHMGNDVWAQFVYGARSAIVLGIGVATAIILLGLVIGLIAGYSYGSIVDAIITFITDIVYFIPWLPLIMIIGMVYGRNLTIIYGTLILLSWPGTARVIRNWAVVLKEAPFVEAAKALGAGTWRILFKHVAPQLIPYLVYSIVMSVPSVIMFEAGIQLIGFGDPTAATWGRMISEAYREGGFLHNAWWWFMPPILGIIAISIGFVLIGIALDEIVNPRLRRR
jgi:ABC-type dipeptide/oligopeptide/nickel transport system permease subunit